MDDGDVPFLAGGIDYGMFSFLAYPLLEVLRFFYKLVGNYGVAIILLTILVRLIFYPLSLKSMRSMKAMQKLQPQIARTNAQNRLAQKAAILINNGIEPCFGLGSGTSAHSMLVGTNYFICCERASEGASSSPAMERF